MKRRNFLVSSAVGLAALVIAPKVLSASTRYVLQGDGVADDTEALQAWIDGMPVYDADGSLISRRVLPVGEYRISRTLEFARTDFEAHGSTYRLSEGAFLDFRRARRGSFCYNSVATA